MSFPLGLVARYSWTAGSWNVATSFPPITVGTAAWDVCVDAVTSLLT
jgi:hypothetical protein